MSTVKNVSCVECIFFVATKLVLYTNAIHTHIH